MSDAKQRHGCLTIWLILMLGVEMGTVVLWLSGLPEIREKFPQAPGWAYAVIVLAAVFDVVCIVALWKWQRWGFWGICFLALVAMAGKATVGLTALAILSPIWVFCLAGVLCIGGPRNGWRQLE